MTILVRTSVKTYFTTGSRPTQSQFGDFIDSALFLAETTSQTIVGSVIVSGSFYAAGGLSSTIISAASMNLTGGASAASLHIDGIVSADALHCSAARIDNGVKFSTTFVSAAGTTQGTAALVGGIINRCQGVTDGVATGFLLPSGKGGTPLYICNESNASANLWPPTGGQINNSGINVVFPMVARTLYTVIPVLASSYFVK